MVHGETYTTIAPKSKKNYPSLRTDTFHQPKPAEQSPSQQRRRTAGSAQEPSAAPLLRVESIKEEEEPGPRRPSAAPLNTDTVTSSATVPEMMVRAPSAAGSFGDTFPRSNLGTHGRDPVRARASGIDRHLSMSLFEPNQSAAGSETELTDSDPDPALSSQGVEQDAEDGPSPPPPSSSAAAAAAAPSAATTTAAPEVMPPSYADVRDNKQEKTSEV